jgi:protein O-mannosyl-transferase
LGQRGRPTPSKVDTKTPKRYLGSSLNRTQVVRRPIPESTILRDVATAMAIFCATLLVYWPALRGSLLWDDDGHITSPALRSLHGLWRIWFELGATQQYYPLLHSAFWIEHRLWGDAVLGYHLANLSQHALSAFLVVLIVQQLELPGAWLAGCIFALHPVCVEAVAWISEQKSTLSATFYLAAALIYLHFDRTRRRSHYFLGLGLFLLALLSKSVTATLPAALLVVFWWRRGRIDWRRDVVPLLPWFALGVTSGLFTAWVERTYIGAQGATYELAFTQHILLTGRVVCFYAGKILWPANLMFSYPRWQLDPAVWWQYLYPLGVLIVLAALLLLALRPAERARRGPLAGFLFFAGTLFPVLGFLHVFPFKFSYVADHFQYLASLGVIVPVAWLLVESTLRISSGPASRVVGVTVLAILAVLTWQQSSLYRDSETLYRATLARNPGSWNTHNNLAGVLAQNPARIPEAIEEYQEALRIKPDYAIAHDSLGGLLMRVPGRLNDAIAEYQAAVRSQPDFVLAHNNLGIALALIPGRLPDAVAEFQAALRLQPSYAKAHMNLGNAYSQTPGRLPDAIAEYETALRFQPDYAPAHDNLGSALMQMPNRLPDAIAEFQTALRLQPNDAQTHELLAVALAQMPGRLPDAIAEYQVALSLQPNDPDIHINLGDALAQIPGQRQQAIAQYQAALQARPDSQAARQSIERLRALDLQPPRVANK